MRGLGRRLATGARAQIALRLPRAALDAVRRGQRVTLTLRLTARDAAGNTARVTRTVT